MNRYVITVKHIVNIGCQVCGDTNTTTQHQFETKYYCDENSLNVVLKNIISATDNIISVTIESNYH